MHSMITPVWIVGFSGHRNLPQAQLVADAVRQALEALQARAQKQGGTIEFYSSAACGADTLAAETAHALGIPVHLILPMPEEAFRADFENEDKTFRADDWQRVQALITNARNGKNGGSLRLARGTHLRPECYYDTGMQVLEACDSVLVVWDELPARGLGGTTDVVDQARISQKPLLFISSETGESKNERLEKFALADEPDLLLIQELNGFAQDHFTSGETPIDTIFKRLDASANQTSQAFRSSLVRSIKFHGWAAVIAAFAVILPKDEPWSRWTLFTICLVEFILVTWALFLSRVHKWRHTHQQWLKARFGAELLRGIRSAVSFADPLIPQILRHAPHWRRFALSAGLSAARDVDHGKDWQTLRNEYVKARLLDQQQHFVEKQAKAAAALKRTQRIGTWATWLAPGFVLIALAYKLHHALSGHPKPEPFSIAILTEDILFRFMPIFVPLVAGIASGLRTALDSSRRTHRYDELAQLLKHTANTVGDLKTESSTRRCILATEEVLLDELIEWKLAEEQNGGH